MRNTSDLFSTGQPVGQLLQAAHHPLVPEVVREGFRPLRQQLEDLWGDLPHSHLEEEDQDQTNKQVRKPSLSLCVCVCMCGGFVNAPCRLVRPRVAAAPCTADTPLT